MSVTPATQSETPRIPSQRGEWTWELAAQFPRQGEWTEESYLARDFEGLVTVDVTACFAAGKGELK